MGTALTAQTEQEWLKARTTGVGSSKAVTILGLNPYQSVLELWAQDSGLVDPPDLSDNEAVQFGKLLEPLVADRYSQVTGRKLEDPGRHTIQRHPKYEWMLATLDRKILPDNGRGPGCLEIKTTGDRHAQDWEEDAPIGPQAQLQHQLAVMGYDWGSLAVLIGGQKFRYIDIPRNDDFIAFMIEREEWYWDLVKRGIPPDPDASEGAREALSILYPKEQIEEALLLPPEASEWAARRKEIKEQVKVLEGELLGIENKIKFAMGEHARGLLPDGSGFRWTVEKRAAYTVAASERRVLREIRSKS